MQFDHLPSVVSIAYPLSAERSIAVYCAWLPGCLGRCDLCGFVLGGGKHVGNRCLEFIGLIIRSEPILKSREAQYSSEPEHTPIIGHDPIFSFVGLTGFFSGFPPFFPGLLWLFASTLPCILFS